MACRQFKRKPRRRFIWNCIETKICEAVPVELEPTPEGQLRQHLQQQEHGTRYDYISFSGNAAMVNKTLRSTLAHLHVALGHVTNDKLKRMLLNFKT